VAPLEPEQEALLATMCEAARSVSRERRGWFNYSAEAAARDRLIGTGLPDDGIPVVPGDIPILQRVGFVIVGSGDFPQVTITPEGFAHWEEQRRRIGEPIQRVEAAVRQYLDAEMFREHYGAAYDKWVQAEDLALSSDSPAQLTAVGHHCREALQLFATALVERHNPPDVDQNTDHDINRVQAVLDQHAEKVGTSVRPFIDAMMAYWRATSGLAQRQEHGAQKANEPLAGEDARRVVFHTAIVMFEVARVVG